jgi:hypothetical protein
LLPDAAHDFAVNRIPSALVALAASEGGAPRLVVFAVAADTAARIAAVAGVRAIPARIATASEFVPATSAGEARRDVIPGITATAAHRRVLFRGKVAGTFFACALKMKRAIDIAFVIDPCWGVPNGESRTPIYTSGSTRQGMRDRIDAQVHFSR